MTRSRAVSFFLVFLFCASAVSHAQEREILRWTRSKPKITKINIEGNEEFSDGEIRKRMYSKTFGFWSALRRDRRIFVQRESLGRDTLEIKYLYLKNGYRDVAINEEFSIVGKDSSAAVDVKIVEGRQYIIGKKTFVGNLEPKFGFNVERIANQLKTGKPLDIFLIQSCIFDIKTLLANEGFPYAKIEYKLDTPGLSEFDDIQFIIDSDSLVHFGEVTIAGNNNFPASVARRELKIKSGKIYKRDDILKSQTRLLESGYFTTVRFDQDTISKNRINPDFVLNVRERKPRYMTVTTGAGQSEIKDLVWNLSGRFGKRNFIGSRRYEILADYSFTLGQDAGMIGHRYRLRYTEPWFLNVRMPLILTGEFQPKIHVPNKNFDRQSWAASAETNRRFGQMVRTTLGSQYEFVKISGVPDNEIQLLKKQEGISARRKIYGAFRRDSRDDLFVPKRGALIDINSEYFGGFLGGDENFVKAQASWSTYQKIKANFISATRFKVGWARAFAGTESVPIDEALFLGGANTVRGFSEESLHPTGPLGEVQGSTYTLVFNQEFRWKTLQVMSYVPILRDLFSSIPLWQSVFFDAGNGFRHTSDVKFEALAYGYGSGFQFISPAGPIRIDYARRIPTKRISFDSRWHFTILYAF